MGVNEAYWICAQTGVTPVALGEPGQGKTQQFYAFCRATNRKPYVLIPSMRDATDFYGCPFSAEAEIGVNGEKRKAQVMRIANPEWAVQCWDGQKWAILLDEMTTALPIIQSCLLRIIAEKHVGEIPLPEDTWILGAANPPETAPNGVEFSPPLANRVYHHKWEVDRDAVLAGFAGGLEFGQPEFSRLPDNWEDHIPAAGGLVAAFHKHLPGRLDYKPQDVAAQGGPWASQRTWEYAVRCLAAGEACGAERAVQHTLVAGLVGRPLHARRIVDVTGPQHRRCGPQLCHRAAGERAWRRATIQPTEAKKSTRFPSPMRNPASIRCRRSCRSLMT